MHTCAFWRREGGWRSEAPPAAGVYCALHQFPGQRLAGADHPHQLNRSYFRARLIQTGPKLTSICWKLIFGLVSTWYRYP